VHVSAGPATRASRCALPIGKIAIASNSS
jgi:hypothetical protein